MYYYHLDQLGTPRELTDAQGQIVWSGQYRAYGSPALADVAEVENPLRFQGQYFDAETGLHYNLNRSRPDAGTVYQPGSDLISRRAESIPVRTESGELGGFIGGCLVMSFTQSGVGEIK